MSELSGQSNATQLIEPFNDTTELSSADVRAFLLQNPEFFAEHPDLDTFERVVVPANEAYAGNSLLVNGSVLVPAGFPATRDLIERLGMKTIEVDVSEFRKMDGGLTCLSIRL